jgi:hypothetical protein
MLTFPSLFAACEEPSASSDDVSILAKRQFAQGHGAAAGSPKTPRLGKVNS